MSLHLCAPPRCQATNPAGAVTWHNHANWLPHSYFPGASLYSFPFECQFHKTRRGCLMCKLLCLRVRKAISTGAGTHARTLSTGRRTAAPPVRVRLQMHFGCVTRFIYSIRYAITTCSYTLCRYVALKPAFIFLCTTILPLNVKIVTPFLGHAD